MKNFLLGGFCFLCIGAGVATSTEILTVRPATPKSTIVRSFTHEYGAENIFTFVKNKISSGYIVKSIAGSNQSTARSTWIVVMEKYN